MRKILLSLLALLSISLQAQYKGLTTLNVKVDSDVPVTHVNVYMADRYFHFAGDAEPVAQVPVKGDSIHYEVMLDQYTAFRFRCVDAGGKEDGNMHSVPVVPGQTYSLFTSADFTGFYSIDGANEGIGQKNSRALSAFREATNWQSPYLPKVKGQLWNMPDCEYGDFPMMFVREVYLGKEETVLRLYQESSMGLIDLLEADDYLTDDAGNKYKVLRPIMGSFGDGHDMEVGVFGAYYAFEPLPKDCKCFTLNARHHDPVTVRPAAKSGKPNFSITITATPGIADTGWLLRLHENLQKYSASHQIADLTADGNRQVTCEFYLDRPRLLDVVATFGDGSICDYYMQIPAVPGNHAEITVKNGVFDWTGTGFYKDLDNADVYIDNAKRYRTEEEYMPLIRRYLVNHANEPGCLYHYYRNGVLDVEELEQFLSDSILATPFGQLIAAGAKSARSDRQREAELKKSRTIQSQAITIDEVEPPVRILDQAASQRALDKFVDEHRASFPSLEHQKIVAERRKPGYQPDVKALRKDMTVGKAVDLGLSVMWADMNVGAKKAGESGNYYTWGDIESLPDGPHTWMSYKWSQGDAKSLTKYNYDAASGALDHKLMLDARDDAASQLWGSNWRMPTMDELIELRIKCTWEKAERDGMSGYKVTGPNGKSIFVPNSGCMNHNGLYGVKEHGYLWTSSLDDKNPSYAYYMGIHPDKVDIGSMDRTAGRPIRPVMSRPGARKPVAGRSQQQVGKAVDLGLSVKWADMNLGAITIEDYGNYYTWGDVHPVALAWQNWSTYRWGSQNSLTKYNGQAGHGTVDNKGQLEAEDDAALAEWGKDWRMPTKEEMEELATKCTWMWGQLGANLGYYITGPNGNTIFMPEAGCKNHQGLYGTGEKGYYWTSTRNPDNSAQAFYLCIQKGIVETILNDRCVGRCIRPVSTK